MIDNQENSRKRAQRNRNRSSRITTLDNSNHQAAAPLADSKGHYLNTIPDMQSFNYFGIKAKKDPTPQASADLGYLTEFPTSDLIPQHNPLEDAIRSEAERHSSLHEKAAAEYETSIYKLLSENGFTNRVDIKKGVTASVAIYQYVGDDEEIKAVAQNGFIMVKLPPYTSELEYIDIKESVTNASRNEDYLQFAPNGAIIHAALTYNNEYKMLGKMASIESNGTRPKLLAKEINGQKFIFNSPIFHDEKEFMVNYNKIISGEYQKQLATLSSTSSSSDEDNISESGSCIESNDNHSETGSNIESDDNLSDTGSSIEIDDKYLVSSLLQAEFINLTCLVQRLASSKVNPLSIMTAFLNSCMFALNQLHDDGIIHADFAPRNVIPKSDYSVALVDFGVSDWLDKTTGRAVANIRYPQASFMNNNDAVKNDHIISVITDYVALQKSILQLIIDYIEADFHKITTDNLPQLPNAEGVVSIAFMLQFTDRIIIDNTKNNLKAAAEKLRTEQKDVRGEYALSLISQFEPYLDHDHNPDHSFKEVQAANNASFQKCLRDEHARFFRSQEEQECQTSPLQINSSFIK